MTANLYSVICSKMNTVSETILLGNERGRYKFMLPLKNVTIKWKNIFTTYHVSLYIVFCVV